MTRTNTCLSRPGLVFRPHFLLTIQNFGGNNSLQWKRWIFGNKCSRIQQRMLHEYLGWCDQGLKSVLSIACTRNLSFANSRSQSCPNWSSLHTDKTRETCSAKKKGKKWVKSHHHKKWLLRTQCFLSTSSSASHFRVRKGCFCEMISPSKKVVKVGYSSVRPLIFR